MCPAHQLPTVAKENGSTDNVIAKEPCDSLKRSPDVGLGNVVVDHLPSKELKGNKELIVDCPQALGAGLSATGGFAFLAMATPID